MTVRIGVNPILWSNDDLRELGGDISLERCLSEARQAGFEGIELGHKFPRDAGVLGPLLAAHDLRLISGWYSTRLLQRDVAAERQAATEHLELLGALGCDVVIVAETSGAVHTDRIVPLSARPTLSGSGWSLLCDRLSEFAEVIAAQGMRLAYHHHMGTVIQTEAEVRQLMQRTPPEVGLLLDTGHLVTAGGNPLAIAQDLGDRVVHVHTKDVRAEEREEHEALDTSFLDRVAGGVFTVPGAGSIDFVPILHALSEREYQGWWVVEADQDPAHYAPLVYARRGCDYLTALGQAERTPHA